MMSTAETLIENIDNPEPNASNDKTDSKLIAKDSPDKPLINGSKAYESNGTNDVKNETLSSASDIATTNGNDPNDNNTVNNTDDVGISSLTVTDNGDGSGGGGGHHTNKLRQVTKIGLDQDGALLPGFEDVNDEQMAFSSESDFAIFIKQISSEIPLQRLVAVKRMIKSCHLWGEEAVLSVLPRVKQLSCDKEMVIRQAIAEVLGPFAKYLVETMCPHTYLYAADDNHDHPDHDDDDTENIMVRNPLSLSSTDTQNNDTVDADTDTLNGNGNNDADDDTANTHDQNTKPKKKLQQSGAERAHQVIIDELLPLVKEMLKDAMEVRQGAGSSLIMIAELLTKEQVYEHILKIVLHMAHDDSDDQKITALPLLGDLAPIVGSSVCKNYLSADLHALSQDNSFRVRKATVQYFGPICEQLGSVDAEECLLPIFLSLCSDSIWSVRKGCVESFVDVSSSISAESRVQLIPIMEKFLNDSSRWVRNTAYEVLGPFIASLSSDQISAEFLKYFTSIPHLSSAEADADCTNHCAFNFPAVVLTVGASRWNELNDTYNILCRKTFKSRKTLACSIHEIATILGRELTEQHLLTSIEFFLKDIDDIRQGIIRNLWKILTVFDDKLRVEYISILWELASEADVNWRFRLLLAQQLDEILPLYEHGVIEEQIVPLIFQLCQDRMADVRYAAVYPIADAINVLASTKTTRTTRTTQKKEKKKSADETDGDTAMNNGSNEGDTATTAEADAQVEAEADVEQKNGDDGNENGNENGDENVDYLQSVVQKIQTIHKGRTYSKRLLYIRIVDACFTRISSSLFDAIFLTDLLHYATDKISNVRFCLARFMKQRLLTQAEYHSHDLVMKTVQILGNDEEDVEVKRFFRSEAEIEAWLQMRRREAMQRHLEQQAQQQNGGYHGIDGDDDVDMENGGDGDTKGGNGKSGHQATKSKDSDLDSTDSSLYSSSDSDHRDDIAFDDRHGEEEDDDEDEDDEDEDEDSFSNDKLKSVSAQLKNIDEELNANKLENMDIASIASNQVPEELLQQQLQAEHAGIEHQDTPLELNIPKNFAEEEQAKNEPVTGNYGVILDDPERKDSEQKEESTDAPPDAEPNENSQVDDTSAAITQDIAVVSAMDEPAEQNTEQPSATDEPAEQNENTDNVVVENAENTENTENEQQNENVENNATTDADVNDIVVNDNEENANANASNVESEPVEQ